MRSDAEITALVEERDRARSVGDYARADALRAELLSLGWGTVIRYRLTLLDEPGGTFWYWTTRRDG